MPSGQTHDRITLWALPFVAGATFVQTKSGNLTLSVASGFMFGGLMFGPDLDIYSRQYQRWGLLRWIWIPYQKSLRHRSFLSHGPIIGTTLRVIYLSGVVGILIILGTVVAQILGNGNWSKQILSETLGRSLNHLPELLALFLGLELGAMSHSLSDWSNSAYKRFQKQGVRGLLPRAKMKKRKRTTTQSNRTRTKRASKTKKR
ncbi:MULTISPECIES: metal-binding protein [Fischerella]|uniref:Metal-binding protein n=1 Tax=Fischerella muscicola CCMEE 5323 TaxID=2019572 RepID=A0A2N6K311_FISMU|nr:MULTISPECIES: metal-binding protein [Fischerella]MBD2429877.1 metal-binding protein [Fischerella sp. FACHB-380]PLZ89742.1 metal-binding protein [Fischerella muscicola CCMEE 5323]